MRQDLAPDDKVGWAVHLAELGFRILPVRPGEKRPWAGEGWKRSRMSEPDAVRAFFESEPDANYGVNPADGQVVIDLDVKPDVGVDGVASFSEMQLGQDPGEWVLGETFTVRTPSSGAHLYMTSPPFPVKMTQSGVGYGRQWGDGPGIDVKGPDGYVVGPGSAISGVPYRVERLAAMAPVPGWVVARLTRRGEWDRHEIDRRPVVDLDTPHAVSAARDYLRTAPVAVQGRGGDNQTYVVAAQVKDLGISETMCLQLMAEPGGWNGRCIPPWEVLGEGDDSLERKVANAYLYGERPPGARSGDPEQTWGHVGDLGTMSIEVVDVASATEEQRRGLAAHLFVGGRFLRREVHREEVIPKWLPAHGLTGLLARRGAGKTLIMVDLALRTASGMDWHGLPIMEGFRPIYLCGEDDLGVEEHVRAWMRWHDVERTPDVIFADAIADLMSGENVERWAEVLRAELRPDERALLFLDTWQRATARAGQNKDDEIAVAVDHAEALARYLDGPAVISFHPPKADKSDPRTILGSGRMENALVAQWNLKDDPAGKRLYVDRIKGARDGSYLLFRFEEVGLGLSDAFGQERTGAVATTVGGTHSPRSTEDHERDRAAFATLLRYLERRRRRDDSGAGAMKFADAKRRVAEALDRARDLRESDRRDEDLALVEATAPLLDDVDLRRWSLSTLEVHMRSCFQDDPREHVFEDGTMMQLSQQDKGRARAFKFTRPKRDKRVDSEVEI